MPTVRCASGYHAVTLPMFLECLYRCASKSVRFAITGTDARGPHLVGLCSENKVVRVDKVDFYQPVNVKCALTNHVLLDPQTATSLALRLIGPPGVVFAAVVALCGRPVIPNSVDELEALIYTTWCSMNCQRFDLSAADEVFMLTKFGDLFGGKLCEKWVSFNESTAIPQRFLSLARDGLLRVIHCVGEEYQVWYPFPFLKKWLRSHMVLFHQNDIGSYFMEYRAAATDPFKRKGFLFQWIQAMEQLVPSSQYWREITKLVPQMTIPRLQRPIQRFSSNSDLTNENCIYIATENSKSKLGDRVHAFNVDTCGECHWAVYEDKCSLAQRPDYYNAGWDEYVRKSLQDERQKLCNHCSKPVFEFFYCTYTNWSPNVKRARAPTNVHVLSDVQNLADAFFDFKKCLYDGALSMQELTEGLVRQKSLLPQAMRETAAAHKQFGGFA